ncbi:uncharacterized protein LOC114287802 [Camellia sinensis]|uniref:uncharacterized protein LOC114287802 n=1 Tax=Camellia sinensis TaxID=4442 RepID=UPI0010356915|nr:uncharacterized protein LOC114287802 [Camellia sinensis]
MTVFFDSEQGAYDFYNAYGGRMGFSIRRDYSRKNKFTDQLIARLLVCNKEGFWKVDKRDPLTKNLRAESMTGCEAQLYVKLDKERVLNEKQYKKLEVGYALCQRLPKVKAAIIMLIQMGNVYTKKIFEEFQIEYFRSIESDIETIKSSEACTIYTVVDIVGETCKESEDGEGWLFGL